MTAAATQWEGRPVAAWRATWQLPQLLVYDSVSSTNDVARARAIVGAPAGLLVMAEHQSAGRGRMGRQWADVPGSSLLMSFVLRPPHSADVAPGSMPLRVGIAVARAIRTATAARPLLKWPNDLVSEQGTKLGGILCEAATGATGDSYVVAGIGINVSQRNDDLPPELRHQATSIEQLAGAACERSNVAHAIVRALTPLFHQPLTPLSPAELDEFTTLDALRGRMIVAHAPDTVLRGTADGIDADGALRVRTSAGVTRVTTATVRPAEVNSRSQASL